MLIFDVVEDVCRTPYDELLGIETNEFVIYCRKCLTREKWNWLIDSEAIHRILTEDRLRRDNYDLCYCDQCNEILWIN